MTVMMRNDLKGSGQLKFCRNNKENTMEWCLVSHTERRSNLIKLLSLIVATVTVCQANQTMIEWNSNTEGKMQEEKDSQIKFFCHHRQTCVTRSAFEIVFLFHLLYPFPIFHWVSLFGGRLKSKWHFTDYLMPPR